MRKSGIDTKADRWATADFQESSYLRSLLSTRAVFSGGTSGSWGELSHINLDNARSGQFLTPILRRLSGSAAVVMHAGCINLLFLQVGHAETSEGISVSLQCAVYRLNSAICDSENILEAGVFELGESENIKIEYEKSEIKSL